jgi:hypothetical protein
MLKARFPYEEAGFFLYKYHPKARQISWKLRVFSYSTVRRGVPPLAVVTDPQ